MLPDKPPQWVVVTPQGGAFQVEGFERYVPACRRYQMHLEGTADLLQFVWQAQAWIVIAQSRDGAQVLDSAPLCGWVASYRVR